MDFERARANMIESQIRPNGVTDPRVIAAMAEVPREQFVPEALRPLAYADQDVPLDQAGAPGRVVIQPMTFARMLDVAGVKQDEVALVVGCASGYPAAIVSRLAESVVAIESDHALAEQAVENLAATASDNVAVLEGPLEEGCAKEAPFDVIIIAGAITCMPRTLLDQLHDGGRAVAVTGSGRPRHIELWTRHGDTVSSRITHDAAIAALPGFAAKEPAFVF